MKDKKHSTPSTIAREALKRLAILKIPPTPDNYNRTYEQIAGTPSGNMSSSTVRILTELTKELPRHNSDLLHLTNSLDRAINGKNWKKYKSILTTFVTREPESMVDSAIQNSSSANVSLEQHHTINNFARQLLELLAQILEHIALFLAGDEALIEESRMLAQQVRKIQGNSEMAQLITNLQQFFVKFETYGETEAKLHQGLLRLLNLFMDSTSELLAEDLWIKKQIFSLKETISKPLNMEIISKAEPHLKQIIQRQKITNNSLGEAKVTLKRMLSSLIDNLEDISGVTGAYQDKLENFSEKINKTNDIE